jgi:hypothetical protein
MLSEAADRCRRRIGSIVTHQRPGSALGFTDDFAIVKPTLLGRAHAKSVSDAPP